jgi:hypothetical protein
MQNKFARLLAGTAFYSLLAIGNLYAQTGTWAPVKTKAPHPNEGACVLMTDGTVLCHNKQGGSYGTGWDRLTPDIHGSYANGTWDTIPSMMYDRLFFSSQVLPSGKLYVAGGEYGPGGTQGEVYDPATKTWTQCGAIPGGWTLYDANSELLYNGNVLEGPQLPSTQNVLTWSPSTLNYTIAPTCFFSHDEAAWLKLPDSSVLFVGMSTDSSNRYIPQTNTWVLDANLPVYLYDAISEAGPAFMLPNKKAIFFGATPANAIYTPSGNISNPGTWAVADSFPTIQGCPVCQSDASGAMMVNGKILCAVSPTNACKGSFSPPTWFLEYDYTTNTFKQNTDSIPGMKGNDSIPIASYQTQMLDLPDGSVLVSMSQSSSYSTSYLIYTPGSGPIPQGKPTINNITKLTCNSYRITGKLFNGISEGAAFGDDWQVATNYPIIRLTNGGNVYYATTSNWNRIGAVATDSAEDTAYFTVPSIPGGTYQLVVTANGFASNPTPFTTYGVFVTSSNGSACSPNSGSISAFASDGVPAYTYAWSPGGATSSSISNLSGGTYTVTVTDNAGCVVTASATIGLPPPLTAMTDSIINVPCNGANSGKAQVVASGGSHPYTYAWTGGGTSTKETGLSAGTYTVIVTDSCGNTATATATITQPAAITTTTFQRNSSTCTGIAAVTANGGTPGYTYLWSPGGQTTDTIKGQCMGTYCCTVTDAHGCTKNTCITIVTGINEVESGMGGLSIYPVPNKGIFTLAFNHTITGLPIVEIYNVLGERVYNEAQKQIQSKYEINLSTQPSGIYFLRVVTQDGTLLGAAKIIIDK